jgi:thiamine pyrophosphate-dependent acetolactate synthase large subunit-like protein
MSVSHDDPKAGDRSSDRGRLLLNTLRLAGVPELFGIPGDLVLPLFQVIEDSAIFPL